MSLEQLKEQLSTLDPASVRAPNMPVATALQEASDLLQLVQPESMKQALIAVGQPPGFDADLRSRIQATREAQSRWMIVKSPLKSEELVALETKALELRSELVAAGRYNLRSSRDALGALSAIVEGEGTADLVQDLFDLATLFEAHSAAFASDQSFDLEGSIALARALGNSLSGDASDDRLAELPKAARDLRDRAFTYLDTLVTELRAAGRYALRSQPSVQRQFASPHERQLRRKASRRAAQPSTAEQAPNQASNPTP